MRDEDYLTMAKIHCIKFFHDKSKINDLYLTVNERNKLNLPITENYNREMSYIFKSNFRNENITKMVHKLAGNTLLLVERIEQGEILLDYLSKLEDKDVYFINGDMPVSERDAIKQKMESCNNIICIAMSKIFSTGISINNIKYIIFCYLGM